MPVAAAIDVYVATRSLHIDNMRIRTLLEFEFFFCFQEVSRMRRAARIMARIMARMITDQLKDTPVRF